MKKLPKINTSELLKAALPYILVGLMATKLGQAYRMASGGDVLDRIFGAFLKIGEAFTNPAVKGTGSRWPKCHAGGTGNPFPLCGLGRHSPCV